jgi:hypothetical protein
MLRTRFLWFALVATAAATLTPRLAHADASVKVPFSFTVAGRVCPAGRYIIKGDPGTTTVTLVGRDSSKIFSWIVFPINGDANPKAVVLRFDQSGSEHVLRSIQYGSQSTTRLDVHASPTDAMQDSVGGGR